MPFSTDALDTALTALAAKYVKVSIHTDDPGATGANKVTGGTPAYADKTVTWGAAGSALDAATGTLPVWDIPAGTTIKYWGLWDSSGGWGGGFALPNNETYTGQGTYESASISLSAV